MTPRTRLSQKIDGLPKWQRWGINAMAMATACLTLIAATKPIWQPAAKSIIVTTVDHAFVSQDTFVVYQQIQHENRKIDSVVHEYERREFQSVKADLDTVKTMLRRRP